MLPVGAFEEEHETWGKRLVWKTGSEKHKTCGQVQPVQWDNFNIVPFYHANNSYLQKQSH